MDLLVQHRWLHASTIISTVRLYEGASTKNTIIYYIRVLLYSAVREGISHDWNVMHMYRIGNPIPITREIAPERNLPN